MATATGTRVLAKDSSESRVKLADGTWAPFVILIGPDGSLAAGSAVTIADGADVAEGARADALAKTGSVSLISLSKYIAAAVQNEDDPHGSGDKGIPVWGVHNEAAATFSATAQDYIPFGLNHYGGATIALQSASAWADGMAAGSFPIWSDGNGRPLGVLTGAWNGASNDRTRNNTEFAALLASAARTVDTNSPDQVNYNWRGGHLIINVTVLTTSVIPTLQGKDPISGNYYNLLTGPSITTPGYTIMKLYPGIQPIAGAAASDILPRTFRVSMDHLDATTMTYSVAFVGIL